MKHNCWFPCQVTVWRSFSKTAISGGCWCVENYHVTDLHSTKGTALDRMDVGTWAPNLQWTGLLFLAGKMLSLFCFRSLKSCWPLTGGWVDYVILLTGSEIRTYFCHSPSKLESSLKWISVTSWWPGLVTQQQ